MKATELNLEKVEYTMLYNPKAGEHVSALIRLGRLFPKTAAQAKKVISKGIQPDAMNIKDVENMELLLNKHGMSGEYKYTKSKSWVRIDNFGDFFKALKLEFNL